MFLSITEHRGHFNGGWWSFLADTFNFNNNMSSFAGRSGRGGRESGGRGPPSGGRGPPGGGRAPSNRNKHMGDLPKVMALLRASGMSDREVLAIVAPPVADRDRSRFIQERSLPPHAAWRMSPSVGARVDGPTLVVKSNFFSVDTSSIPTNLYQYAVHFYKPSARGGPISNDDCAGDEDDRILIALMSKLRVSHSDWFAIPGFSLTYDGRSMAYSSQEIPLTDRNEIGQPYMEEMICVTNLDGSDSSKRFKVTLTRTAVLTMGQEGWRTAETAQLNALDSAVLSFARWNAIQEHPDWFTVGSKAFRSTAPKHSLNPLYNCMKGYFAGLKTCMAGLTLVCDMSVSAFLTGGDLVNIMALLGGFQSVAEMARASSSGGLNERILKTLDDSLKKAKVSVKHLGHWRKIRSFGPPSNSPKSAFQNSEGKSVTVAEYFATMCRDRVKGAMYKRFLPNDRLEYPSLPTVNVGSNTRPVYIPPELLVIPDGQCRSQAITGDLTASMIRYSAIRPDERMKFIESPDSLVSEMSRDPIVTAFGLNRVCSTPLSVPAILLPPAKLRYAGGQFVEPGISGAWNVEGKKCVRPPTGHGPQGVVYAVVLVGSRPPRNYETEGKKSIQDFITALESVSKVFGNPLKLGGPPLTSPPNEAELRAKFDMLRRNGAKIIICILCDEVYGLVKLAADLLGIMTQCLKWKNIERTPSGYHLNVAYKMVSKLGGAVHTLASRLPADKAAAGVGVYQDPPASISWLFDKPCMLVGIDVSHPDVNSPSDSVAAVVASMDGRIGQYAAHVSLQKQGDEMVNGLQDAMISLFTTYRAKNNGQMPQNILVYRDGVAEGQFQLVVEQELPSIRSALELMGYTDSVKIAIVICQKGHHTRLSFLDEGNEYVNPCPGLVVDSSGGSRSITHADYNEFYLNSHVSIQGTAKPCKYSLIHDEIGFKISELELMTYWSTFMYARCSRSVSYATPAYYAHWASKRGRYLLAAGATSTDLLEISSTWGRGDKASTMFFI